MSERSPTRPTSGRRKNVAGTILATLVDEIVSGHWPPSSPLPSETQLSKRFGVSRTALREAMRHLVAHGMIESRTRAGTTVLPRQRWNRLDSVILAAELRAVPDGDARRELREAMFFLMSRAAALAAERASAAEVATIEQLLGDLERQDPAGGARWAAVMALYAAVFDATGNWVFRQMGRLVGPALERRSAERPSADPERDRTLRWLKGLLDAVRLQRVDEARNAMKKLVALHRAEEAPIADAKG